MSGAKDEAKDRLAAVGLGQVAKTETVHHESRSTKQRPLSRVSDINMTPMLDVVFLLLIFFVLTASFNVGEGILPADLPSGEAEANADDEPPPQPVEITLRSRGRGEMPAIDLGGAGSLGSFLELSDRLSQLQRSEENPTAPFSAEDPIIIRSDSEIPWAHLVNAFNAAFRARYTNINFAQPSN